MNTLARDLRYALRVLRRSPLFTAVAVLSLALGIGANTAIFTLVNQLILRLLPVREPERIVLLAGRGRHYGGNNGRNALAYPMYQDLREHNQVFSGMMCRYSLPLVLGVSSHSEVASAELVSGNYFPLLGIRPAAGRLFTSADDQRAGQHPQLVLSYAYWKAQFNGDPAAIGKTVRITNYPFTIVGVAQAGFEGLEPGLPAKIFLPMTMASTVRPGFTNIYDRRQRWVNVYGRLKQGMTLDRTKAGLQPLFHQIINAEVTMPAFRNATPYDKTEFLRMWLDVMPGSQGNTNLRRQYEKPLWVLMALTGLVLLIACANLAGLLTARAMARQKEIAVRLAIGSSRAGIVRQLLAEGLLLSLAGGVAGIALAMLMVSSLLKFLPPNISGYSISASPDPGILGFACAISALTGLLFGLVPALQASRPEIAPTLKDQAGNIMGGGAQVAFRKILVTAQVTLSLLLLIGAGIFIRSLANLHSLDPGFRTENIVEFRVNPRSTGYDIERTRAFYTSLGQRVRAIPGVLSAGMAQMGVLTGNEWDSGITIAGYNSKAGEDMGPHFNSVTPGYFDALGIHVLNGRDFSAKDTVSSPRVAIVNASFAQRYFGTQSPVGHKFGLGTDPGTPTDIEIVGVVNDTRYEALREKIPREVFMCETQSKQGSFNLWIYARTTRAPEGIYPAIRSVMRDIDPGVPLMGMKTLNDQLDESLVTERMVATLSSVFGALATALAVLGLYGVMSYMVMRRAREIGIRMALGALRGSVVWMVMREVLVLAGAGIVAGIPAALVLAKLVANQLYGIEPQGPASIAAAVTLLAAVAALAGYIPARRAARYDPAHVLRYE
jgi:predicted permease